MNQRPVSRWTQLAMRSGLLFNRPKSGACNFDDVMAIYDHDADDAIDKLNTLREFNVPTSTYQVDEFADQNGLRHQRAMSCDAVVPIPGDVNFKKRDSVEKEDAEAIEKCIGPDNELNPTPRFKESNASMVSNEDEVGEELIQPRQSTFIMSAPIQLQYTQLRQKTAFTEVRGFLLNEKYDRFVATLLRAIKSDSVQAVRVMVEILKTFGFDLYEPMFRESAYTASMLHVALLFKRDEICNLLIKEFPKLVTVKYESDKFRNQTVFHIAASNGQFEILDTMLNAVDEITGKQLINTVADGTFFTDVHQGGALALTAAAYSGHHEMLRQLIEKGADPDVKSYNGNTVLHFIVILSSLYPQSTTPRILFDEVRAACPTWWQRRNVDNDRMDLENQRKMAQADAFRHLLSIRNNADQNVLALAVHLTSNLTTHILNTEHIYKLPQTKFGAMSWSTYDVTEIVSFASPLDNKVNRYNPQSVLHILAYQSKMVSYDESFRDLIDEEPIYSLVKMKWQTYRFVYIAWCILHLLIMSSQSVISLHFLHPDLNKQAGNTNDDGSFRTVRLIFMLFAVYPVLLVVSEVMDFFSTRQSNMSVLNGSNTKKRGIRFDYISDHWSATGNTPHRITGFLYSVSTLIWLGFHFYGTQYQDLPLAIAMIFGWIFMLFFTRGCRHVCHFSIMMQKMFFQDCLYFLTVYCFFWIAFSTGMHVLLMYGQTTMPNFGITTFEMLNVITDLDEKVSYSNARVPIAAATLLSIYGVVTVVLLLNMLIAMMNTSYEAVKSSKTNIYRHQQLSILLMFERRLWWWTWLCQKSQCRTWSPKEKENRGKTRRLYLEINEKSSLQSH